MELCMNLFGELKRRNVFRVAAAYVLAAWVLLQAIDFMLDAIGAPNWILQVFIIAAVAGFLVVVVFSWVFEVTPEGIRREKDIDRSRSITAQTGRRLDRVIIVFLALAVAVLLADRFLGSDNHSSVAPTNDRVAKKENGSLTPIEQAGKEKSIAVLPFVALSSGPDDEFFADGLTEEILNALTQLPELLVTARTSAFFFKGQEVPIQDIAAKLGVANIVEGSVRRSGERLRVTAQLIRAKDGFHLWSENYDSSSADTIAVQEDIAEKIATAMNVVMDENRREAMRRVGLRDVEAFIAMQKGLDLFEKAHGDPGIIAMLRQANGYFDQVAQRVPTYTPAYWQHSDLYIHQLMAGAGGEPGGITSKEEVDEAMSRAKADYAAVLRYAQSPEERHNAELDLAFVSGEWQGMPARIERFAGERGCVPSMWVDNVTYPFGYAAKVLPRSQEVIACDPLSTSAWRSAVRAQLWSGDAESALQTARRGMTQAPGEWLSMTQIFALVALGKFDEAQKGVAERLQVAENKMTSRVMIAAAQGNRLATSGLLEQYEQSAAAEDFSSLLYYAWGGERDKANRAAARIDEHAFGSPELTVALMWCLCGSPWDLSATPKFAADISESGLPWPPASPVRFPLKDW
jgi:adenylate cyclase